MRQSTVNGIEDAVNENTPPGENAAGMNHGNGELWTAMWPHNVVIGTPDYIDADGSVGMKWPWWRGVKGKLAITGRRLDANARPLTAVRDSDPESVALPGYGSGALRGPSSPKLGALFLIRA